MTQYPNGGAVIAISDGAAEAYVEIPAGTRHIECYAATTAVWVDVTNTTDNSLTSDPGGAGKGNVAPPIAGAKVEFALNPGRYPKHSVSNAVADVDGSRERVGTYLHYKTAAAGAATLYVNYSK